MSAANLFYGKDGEVGMKQPWGNYIALLGVPDNLEDLIPEHFGFLYKSAMDGIKALGGKPDFESLKLIIKLPEGRPTLDPVLCEMTTIGVRIDADLKEGDKA